MKLAIAAVVLFCCGIPTTASAQCFRGSCSTGVTVLASAAPATQITINQGRQAFLARLAAAKAARRASRSRQDITVQVNSGVPFQTAGNFQFVQPAQFVALPQPILGVGLNAYSGVSGYGGMSDDAYLNARLREEIGELVERKEIISELKDRLGL